MEKIKSCNKREQMIKEIVEGIEAANQLRNRMFTTPANHGSNYDDQALYDSLIKKMLSSFDNSIFIAKSLSTNDLIKLETCQSFGVSSPRSHNSHHDLHVSKKRKTMPRWTKNVYVSPGIAISGLEGPLDDGLSWRKYGQKDILGSKHPRGYYRCTYRPSQGCQATKQVQRSDEDPCIYHVIYRGEHTCRHVAQTGQPEIKPNNQAQFKTEAQTQTPSLSQPPQSPQGQEVFLNLGPDDNLVLEPIEQEGPAQIFRCFSFTSALREFAPVDDNLNFISSPAFGSPETSGSDYFPASPRGFEGPAARLFVQTSESDLNGPVSGPNSVSNSPLSDTGCDFDFALDNFLDLDQEFCF